MYIKKNKFFFVLIFLSLNSLTFANNVVWVFRGLFGFSYNQTAISTNWTGNEKNNKNWQVKVDASAERDSEIINWLNTLKLEYGKTEVENIKEQISSDLLVLDSIWKRKINQFINPFVNLRLETVNDRFLRKVSYIESTGNSWNVFGTLRQVLKTRIGIALKQQFDKKEVFFDASSGLVTEYSSLDDPSTANIEETRNTVGGEWVTFYEFLISENAKFNSEARVFSGFNGGANLRFDNSLYLKYGKYLTTQLNYLLIYNYDRFPRPSWPDDIESRFTISFGISFNLF